jgi:hypothetical protein
MPSISIAIFGSAIGARSGSVIHVVFLLQAIVQGKHGEPARVIEPSNRSTRTVEQWYATDTELAESGWSWFPMLFRAFSTECD